MAMDCGATGILGGRAFWKEYFLEETPEARSRFAAETGARRVEEVDAIVRQSGSPWFAKYGLTHEDFQNIRAAEGWHFRYSPHAESAGGASGHVVRAGEVY